jgi:hypothetical protein
VEKPTAQCHARIAEAKSQLQVALDSVSAVTRVYHAGYNEIPSAPKKEVDSEKTGEERSGFNRPRNFLVESLFVVNSSARPSRRSHSA